MSDSQYFRFGFSVLELLVAIVVIVLMMSIAIARMRSSDRSDLLHKDVTGFTTQVARALSMVEARNSATCATDETLESVAVVRQGVSAYSLIPYCALRISPNQIVTPLPVHSFTLSSSQFDSDSDVTFATFHVDGSIDIGTRGMILIRGNQTCTVNISSRGVLSMIGSNCPPQ